jgi:hypothetical protein
MLKKPRMAITRIFAPPKEIMELEYPSQYLKLDLGYTSELADII